MSKIIRVLCLTAFVGLIIAASASAQVVPKVSVEVGKATQPG